VIQSPGIFEGYTGFTSAFQMTVVDKRQHNIGSAVPGLSIMETNVSRFTTSVRAILASVAVGLGVLPVVAEIAKPSSVDVLFERKHLANVDAGADLAYRFKRTVSSPEILGEAFSDDIHVQIKKVAANGNRDVVVKIFTGERAREPQPIEDLTGNPILVVFLDRAVSSYMSVAGGKIPYLKDKFRTALRERSTVEPVKVTLGGKQIDGYRVSVAPYAGDLHASKMRGFENSKFSFVVSDAVPGQFVELVAKYENTDKAAPTMEERTVMIGAEVAP
jgi:hypothetical protein